MVQEGIMSQISGRLGSQSISHLLWGLFLALLTMLAIPQASHAQGNVDSAPSACVPSDLNALIVPDGKAVHVSELKEGLDRKGEQGGAFSVDASLSLSGVQQRKDAYEVFSKEARKGNP